MHDGPSGLCLYMERDEVSVHIWSGSARLSALCLTLTSRPGRITQLRLRHQIWFWTSRSEYLINTPHYSRAKWVQHRPDLFIICADGQLNCNTLHHVSPARSGLARPGRSPLVSRSSLIIKPLTCRCSSLFRELFNRLRTRDL